MALGSLVNGNGSINWQGANGSHPREEGQWRQVLWEEQGTYWEQ